MILNENNQIIKVQCKSLILFHSIFVTRAYFFRFLLPERGVGHMFPCLCIKYVADPWLTPVRDLCVNTEHVRPQAPLPNTRALQRIMGTTRVWPVSELVAGHVEGVVQSRTLVNFMQIDMSCCSMIGSPSEFHFLLLSTSIETL